MTSDSKEKLDIVHFAVVNHQNRLPKAPGERNFPEYLETESLESSTDSISKSAVSFDLEASSLDKNLSPGIHNHTAESDHHMSVENITDMSADQYNTEISKNVTISFRNNCNNANCVDEVNEHDKTCIECQMTFKYKRHLGRHLEGHQKNNCPHCNAKFARRKHLEVHLFHTHGERVTKYLYTCDVCSRSFPKKILLNRHRAKHKYENGKVCPECGEMLDVHFDEREHKDKYCIKKPFECKQCLQTFSTEQTYLVHHQNHGNYKCSECAMTFASKKKVQEHYRVVHSPRLESIKANETYSCNECNLVFFKKDEYTSHLEFTVHQNKTVEEISPSTVFPCYICEKKLISHRALVQHIRRTHRGEKRFMCDIYDCAFQCARKTDLDRHKQLHVEQRNVICEYCGKTFTSVSILNDHVLYVHNKEKQFVCEECGNAFKRNSLLKRHKLSHQQHRPFACMECNTAFKRSHHLTRHLETCHRIVLERKQKVLKLMKTDDGLLVPVPEQPKKIKSPKTQNTKQLTMSQERSEKLQLVKTNAISESSELQVVPLLRSNECANSSHTSLELKNVVVTEELTPHVLSVVAINSGDVVTVEVASPETLGMNDLVDQFEMICNEIPSLSDYNDLEFQNSILNSDQNDYDHNSYSESPLGNVEGTSLLLDHNTSKTDILPTIENYLAQPFSAFLNL